jgi:lysozyme
MKVSRPGAGAIAGHETIYLFSYRDAASVLTDGVGNTAAAGTKPPRPGGKITLADALATFEHNLDRFGVRVTRAIRVPLAQHQFDSAVSLDFNTGAIASGTVDDRLNAGDVEGALRVWGQYVRAGGKVLRGLETRRREEIELFRTGRYPARGVLVKDAPSSAGRVVPVSSLPWGQPVAPLTLDPSAADPLPPMPTPAPVRGSGNALIDIGRYLWSLWK